MPWRKIPFDPIIDFQSLRDKDVLEIGVGNGSHAQLISVFAKSYTGIDLTSYAVQSTSKRLELMKNEPTRQTTILSMDAEQMEFPDESFDFVWSWGVIHHSSNTRKILEEIGRVLKPGGTTTLMVYHRSFWSYHIFAGLFGGVLRGQLPFNGGVHRARQQLIDGAIARYYTRSEWQALVSDLFITNKIAVYGSKQELLPMPSGQLKDLLRRALPDWCGRFLTNRCKLGMFLVTELRKRP